MNPILDNLRRFTKTPVLFILVGLAAVFLTGCGNNPGKWDVERITSEMAEKTKMEIVVTKEEDGSLTAKGIDRKERRYTFIIEQDPKKREIKWTSYDANGKLIKVLTSRDI